MSISKTKPTCKTHDIISIDNTYEFKVSHIGLLWGVPFCLRLPVGGECSVCSLQNGRGFKIASINPYALVIISSLLPFLSLQMCTQMKWERQITASGQGLAFFPIPFSWAAPVSLVSSLSVFLSRCSGCLSSSKFHHLCISSLPPRPDTGIIKQSLFSPLLFTWRHLHTHS